MSYPKPSWYKRNETDAERKAREDEAIRQNAENRAVSQRALRNIFSHFMLWRVCPDKRCLRARACRGDLDTCNRERWRVVVPDWFRIVLGKASDLARDGMPWKQAVRAAIADVTRREELMAEAEARRVAEDAAKAAAPPAPQVTITRSQPRPGLPRIRSL